MKRIQINYITRDEQGNITTDPTDKRVKYIIQEYHVQLDTNKVNNI